MSQDMEPLAQSTQRWLGVAAVIVTPTSLITGLCYFFGLLSIRQRLMYFGVDPSELGFTSADYVVTTIGVFFFAVLRALLLCAALVLFAVAVRRWAAAGRRIRLLRALAWILLGLGVVSLGNAVVWLVSDSLPVRWLIPSADAMYTAASILAGVGLLVVGYWMLAITSGVGNDARRLPARAERVLLALAVTGMVVALFWITDEYAANIGDGQGRFNAGRLWASDTAITLDTTEALNIPASLVKTSVLPSAGPAAAPTYRYECLRVLEVHGGRYVLVPAKWTRELGYAITVTPDATHRITAAVHAGLANITGGDANVRPFWQCPEVVRSFHEDDLDGMLVGSDVAQTIVDSRALTAGGIDSSMSAALGGAERVSANDCAPEGDSAALPPAVPPYPQEGTATRHREMTGDGPSGRLWMRERVTSFPDPATAAGFVGAAQLRWGYCAGKVTIVERHGAVQRRILASPGVQNDILAVSDSAQGSAVNDCAEAIGAKSNVVIHVDVCGAAQPLLAVGIVAAVRDRIPT